MTEKKAYALLEELAFEDGMSPEEYLERQLEAAKAKKSERFSAYPKEVSDELMAAENLKAESRAKTKKEKEKAALRQEISGFVKAFPGVNPEDIPKEVWEEVARGIPLPHAYALFLTVCAAGGDGDITGADATNAENDRRAAVISTSSGEVPAFTREEVEKMTPDKVKGNYKKILSSMKKWKF